MLYNEAWHNLQDEPSERYANVIANNHEIKVVTALNNVYVYTRHVIDGEIQPTTWTITKNGVLEYDSAVAPDYPLPLDQTLTNPQSSGYYFGRSISIYENFMVIGADSNTAGATNNGQAFIYQKADDAADWELIQTISNPVLQNYAYFGYAVEINGSSLAISCPRTDDTATYSGEVYLYEFNGTDFDFNTKIDNPSPDSGDYFGSYVEMDGNTLVIAAEDEDPSGITNAGRVYTYTKSGSTWSPEDTISNPAPSTGDKFGYSLSISGDTMVISAPFDNSNIGIVYTFTRTAGNWTLEDTIPSVTGTIDDAFGISVSILGDTLAIGSRLDDTVNTQSGAVWTFTRTGSTWTEQQTIYHPTSVWSAWFGYSINFSQNDLLAIGAYGDGSYGTSHAGAAFIYELVEGVWTVKQSIQSPSPSANGFFGKTVEMYNDTLAVGSTNTSNAGTVHMFGIPTGEDTIRTREIIAIDPLLRWFYQEEEIPTEVTIN